MGIEKQTDFLIITTTRNKKAVIIEDRLNPLKITAFASVLLGVFKLNRKGIVVITSFNAMLNIYIWTKRNRIPKIWPIIKVYAGEPTSKIITKFTVAMARKTMEIISKDIFSY